MKEFFQNLKDIREKKGITLDDISAKSRLSKEILQAIESGKFEELPQGYDRIFFKRYLSEIGEDKEEVWQDFNLFFGTGPLEQRQPSHQTMEPETVEEGTDFKHDRDDKEKKSLFQDLSLRFNMDKLYLYFWVTVTIVVLGVVGYFAYQQFVFVKNSQFQVKEVTVSEFIEEMQRQDSLLTPTIAEKKPENQVPGGKVNVELKAVHRTWVREIRDGVDTSDYIMPAGFNQKISGNNSVQLLLGRADGVRIWLNGDSLGVMGAADEIVVRLFLTAEGIVDKRLKKSTKVDTPADTTVTILNRPPPAPPNPRRHVDGENL